MLPGMPVTDFEVSHLACRVPVAISVTQSAHRGLTGSVVVGRSIGEIRVANTHRLGLYLRESPVVVSARCQWRCNDGPPRRRQVVPPGAHCSA